MIVRPCSTACRSPRRCSCATSGRGFHSSTFQHDGSTPCGICWVVSVTETAQVELRSGLVYAPDFWWLHNRLNETCCEAEADLAGGVMRTSTPLTLNIHLLLRVSVLAFALKASHALISVECLFSMTLVPGHAGVFPLPHAVGLSHLRRGGRGRGHLGGWPGRQGLTLVHFSPQPEPFLSLTAWHYPAYPTKGAYLEPKSGRVSPCWAGGWTRPTSSSSPRCAA